MTLHLNLPGSSHRNASEQQQEGREARRLLKERIRTDWEYPTLPAWRSSGQVVDAEDAPVEDKIAGFRFHNPGDYGRASNGSGEALGLDFDPVEWRERGYSSEESSPDSAVTPTSAKSKSGSTYRFDNPDSVGTQLTDRRVAKRRKRCKALEEEMEWNDGLAHWTHRRNLWCCARTPTEIQLAESSRAEDEAPPPPTADSTSASAGSSPRTSTSSAGDEEEEPDPPESTPGSSPSTTPDISNALPSSETTTPPALSPLEVLVPIAPPLLPNHPVRRRISSNMYPEIYTKIILQSRTPSVPINLQTLVNALVQGWKSDGEWPPKNAPLEKSIGRKKGSGNGGLREGVKAVGRVFRLTGVGGGETSKNA